MGSVPIVTDPRTVGAALVAALLLSGCAGGGGADTAAPTSAPASAATTDTAQQDQQDQQGEDKTYPELQLDDRLEPIPAPPAGADPTVAPAASEPAADAGGSPTFSLPTVPLGTPAVSGSWEVTIHGIVDPLEPVNTISVPEEGSRFVGLDMEVHHLGTEPRTFSASFSTEMLLTDGTFVDVRVATLHEPPGPGGEMKPGERQRGIVVYEVRQAVDVITDAVIVLGRAFATSEPAYLALR